MLCSFQNQLPGSRLAAAGCEPWAPRLSGLPLMIIGKPHGQCAVWFLEASLAASLVQKPRAMPFPFHPLPWPL